MLKANSLVILSVFINLSLGKKYYNYSLFRSIPVIDSHLSYLNNMRDFYEIYFWRAPGLLFRPVEFVVSPEDKTTFLADAKGNGIHLTSIIEDVQQAFDLQTVKNYVRRNMESFDWRHYFRLKDIYNWLKDLKKAYPTELQIETIGKTSEDRKILALRLRHNNCKMRSKVVVEGGIHAREWISHAFVTYMLNQILHAPETNDTQLKEIALLYEWYFIPVVNPDGYEYSHTTDRMWRKNRNKHGVDLNRNFGYGFGTTGVSKNQQSEVYPGPNAFSEAESIALGRFITEKSANIEYYLAFHSYGQYMVIPYAQYKTHLENFAEMKEMGLQAAEQISRRYKTQYTIGTAYDTVGYTTSGVSGCWVKHQFKIPYVITFELRDNGNQGFALAPDKILPTCEEAMDGMLSLLTPRSPSFMKLDIPSALYQENGQDSNIFKKNILIVFGIIIRQIN